MEHHETNGKWNTMEHMENGTRWNKWKMEHDGTNGKWNTMEQNGKWNMAANLQKPLQNGGQFEKAVTK